MTMSEKTFQQPTDRRFARALGQAAPAEAAAYAAFQQAVVQRTDGAIPPKVRELIALGVALTTQCPYCLETHTAAARRLGATKEELAEVVYITSALCAGAAAAHGLLAMKLYEHAAETEPAK
jgi:AhpD family alkylhydroperoxidase